MSSDRSSAVVVGCLLAGLLGVVGVIVLVTVMLLRGGAESTAAVSPEPGAAGTEGTTSSGVAPASAGTAGSSRPVQSAARGETGSVPTAEPESGKLSVSLPVTSATRVDPQHLFAPATQLAQKLEPQAEVRLLKTEARGPVREGMMDLSGGFYVWFQFAYYRLDRTKPAGADAVRGVIEVRAERGLLTAILDPFHSNLDGTEEALPQPTCPVAQAWRTVVGSGVPANTAARLVYNKAFWRHGRPHWSFHVDGHPDYFRKIDAMTCKLLDPPRARKPVSPPAGTPPGKPTSAIPPPRATPPPPKPRPQNRPGCGCGPTDLMCQMKCQG